MVFIFNNLNEVIPLQEIIFKVKIHSINGLKPVIPSNNSSKSVKNPKTTLDNLKIPDFNIR